ncbi:hypothetical protein RhiirB3_453904, partial [Rhizophagus irregularis]
MIEYQFTSDASQGFHPPNSAIPNNSVPNNHSLFPSPLINFGQINVNDPSSTFYHQNGSSRLDYIWSSPGFPAPGLFSHVETCPKLNDNQFTDHRVLITAFNFSSYFATLAKARLKQKSEQRTIFLYKNLKDDIWDAFSNEVNSRLELYLATHHPSISSLSAFPLDKLWHALKRSILG